MSEPKKAKEDVRIPLKWNVSPSVITRFASNIVVQGVDDVVKLSFFETVPEIRLDSSAPVPKEVRAECVASIVITREKLKSFINALQIHQKRYDEEISIGKAKK